MKKPIKKNIQEIKEVQNTQKIQQTTKKTKLSKKQRLHRKRKQKLQKLKQIKGQLSQQLTAAQSSTKSMGKFDRKAHKDEIKHKVKRHKVHSNFNNVQQEIERNLQILNLVKTMNGNKKINHSL